MRDGKCGSEVNQESVAVTGVRVIGFTFLIVASALMRREVSGKVNRRNGGLRIVDGKRNTKFYLNRVTLLAMGAAFG